jgi:hypothetical protein
MAVIRMYGWIPVVMLGALLFVNPLPVLGASGPRLVLGETLFDAGKVKEGEFIEFVFPVSNQGDRVLEINDVKSD